MIITDEYRRAHAEQYQALRAFKREQLLLERMTREHWPDDQVEEQKQKAGAAYLRVTQAREDYLVAEEKQRELNATTTESDNRLTRGRDV